MRDDWMEPMPPKAPAKPEEPKAKPAPMSDDDFDAMLADYDRRKQQEAERIVKKAFEIETARRKGAEIMQKYVIPHAREVAGRLRQAGHRVVYQELLEAYPPNLRLHLYPKGGPMDLEQPSRRTLELTWGDPDPDKLHATRWTSTGLADMVDLGSVSSTDIDELWVREQFLNFVRTSLELS
jgi:hypothetical protein